MFTVYPQCSCYPTFGSAVILESNRNLVITQLMWPMAIVRWAKESQGEIAWIIYLCLLNSGNLLQLYNTIYFEQEYGQDRKTYIEKIYLILSIQKNRIEIKQETQKQETTTFKDFLLCLTITVSTLDNLLLIKTW